jgi:predicted TIM-barrel fold metal-dependent hydrolase
MSGLRFFDCNVTLGRVGYKHPRQPWRGDDILKEMNRCGIAGALVYHGLAKVYSPNYGNQLLEAELRKSPRFFGCWAVLPHHMGDFPEPEELLVKMREKNIVAAKIFPKSHNFEPNRRSIGELLKVFSREHIPLLVDASEINFNQIAELMEIESEQVVILQGLSWSMERFLFPLMDEFTGLSIEFSALQSNEIIEICYERYGPDRLFFGSGMPAKSPGAARALIDYARIPDGAKAQIAGDNLSRLIGVHPLEPEASYQDPISDQARRGEPIDVLVLDSHTHLIEDGGGCGGGRPMLRGDIDSMVKAYDRLGIHKMTIASWLGIEGDSEGGNAITEAAINRYPDRVIGYVTIDPIYIEDVKAEALKWHGKPGFLGLKPYFSSNGIRYTHKVYQPWWEFANEKHLFSLVDPGGYGDHLYAKDIDDLAQRYPQVSFFMDHAAASFARAEVFASVAKKFPNVYLQLTYTTVTLGAIEYLVEEVGAHKILFGTDSPMRDPRPQLGWLVHADISLEDKKAILGGNMDKILARCCI